MIHAYKCWCVHPWSHGTHRGDSPNSCHTLISMSGAVLHFFSFTMHPVVWNCWYQRLMPLGDGGSLLNCRRNARWTETTDSCFTNCSTQNAFGSGAAIIAHAQKTLNTCCFLPCGKLTSAGVFKAVMQIETAPIILIHLYKNTANERGVRTFPLIICK